MLAATVSTVTLILFLPCVFVVYLLLYYNKPTPKRCFFELPSAIFISLLAYDSWTYVVIYIIFALCDIFIDPMYFAPMHVYMYIHAALTICVDSVVPWVSVFPFFLTLLRFRRAYLVPSSIPVEKGAYSRPRNFFSCLV